MSYKTNQLKGIRKKGSRRSWTLMNITHQEKMHMVKDITNVHLSMHVVFSKMSYLVIGGKSNGTRVNNNSQQQLTKVHS